MDEGERRDHWEGVYSSKQPHEVSWYQPVPARSLELIRATGIPLDAPVIDVGGGASTLVDHLLAAGYGDLTVLDIAPAALAAARQRLGPHGGAVAWVAADVTVWQPPRQYRLWHDRAVFHFLTDAADRARYLAVLEAALAPGGDLVLATFGPDGPTRCSGLPVERYSAEELSRVLGPAYALRHQLLDTHETPSRGRQQFLYGWWKKGRPENGHA